jgi:peptidoglycan glycosyltransferase
MLVGFDKLNGTYTMDMGGGEIRTTISAQVQGIALQALDGRKGTVGVYNYKTGEILCAVSSPTFDPLSPPDIAGDTSGKYDGVYVYRFFHSTYTPGSIFKLTTTAAALESLPELETMRFTCTGSCRINGEKITCSGVHGEQSFSEALANSCNCAFAQLAQELGPQRLAQKVREIRLTQSLDVDGIRTSAGHFDLSGADANALAWAAIGQYTDLVNPCQYMVYLGAIANGGQAAEPYLVSRVKRGGGVKHEAETRLTEQMLTPAASQRLRELMLNNTETAYQSARIKGVKLCAKSGTAQKGEGRSTALFTGFLDSEDYPLAFIVVVEEGGGGAANAGPVAKTVLQACINVLNGEQ